MSGHVVWAIVIGCLVGVFLRSIFDISWPVALFVMLLAVLALAASYRSTTDWKRHLLVAIALTAVALGMLRMDVATHRSDPILEVLLGTEVIVEGVVAREPDVRESSTRITVDATSLTAASTSVVIDARILVVAPAHTTLAFGDSVRSRGVLHLPEPFDSDGGRIFDYPMFLAKDGILYTLAFAEVERLQGSVAWQPEHIGKTLAIRVKQLFLRGLSRAIPEPEAGLASGITVGEKRSMGEDLTVAFTRSSLIHIVVLSGYNITVVINAVSQPLEFAPRLLRFGVSGLVVAFFILMTGGAATAVRAGLMALLAVYARTSGRTFLALRALGFACLVMVLWNPYTLLFDPSFQLSALATAGLILFTPLFAAHLTWVSPKWGMREVLASTLATQLTVLPLLLFQSGSLSLVAIPANLLVLVAIPPAMALSAIAAIGGLVGGVAAPVIGFPAYIILSYVIGIAQHLSSLPFAALTIPVFSAWWLIPAYVGLYFLYRHLRLPTGERGE